MEKFTEEVTTTSYNNTYSDVEGDYDDGYNEGDDEDDERSQSAIGMFMSNAKLLRGHTAPLPEFGCDTAEGRYQHFFCVAVMRYHMMHIIKMYSQKENIMVVLGSEWSDECINFTMV